MAKPTEEQIKQATKARIHAALAAIQRAQNELGIACGHLSALQWAAPKHTRASKLYDKVHAFWYEVDRLYGDSRVRLDPLNIEELQKRLEERAAKVEQGGAQ